MEFPFFELDFYGNRLLIAVCAILHVIINHPLAVGGALLIACMEARGDRLGDARWDDLARRLLMVCFIITTTVGALTGVGIWLTTALVNPDAIGSLLRVFFWAWFVEWLVFITEVVLILAYALTWTSWTGARKRAHIRLGYALAAFSWITMALITAILGFMMDPGAWRETRSLVDGVLNPIYLPQLAFRTGLAMVMAGGFALVGCWWFTARGDGFRAEAVRWCCRWMALWGLPTAAAAGWYLSVIPDEMLTRAPVALGTIRWSAAYEPILAGLVGLAAVTAYVAVAGWRWPASVPRWAYAVPIIALCVMLAVFERTREFIRKPWIIADYMYANGIRAEDYPLYQAEGLLRHHPYATVRVIDDGNRLRAGHEIYRIACATCHTAAPGGVNSVHRSFERMLGSGPWKEAGVAQIIAGMHGSRSFMPEFPGTPAERRALAAWVVEQHRTLAPPAPAAATTAIVARKDQP
jgi:hypothetical protein